MVAPPVVNPQPGGSRPGGQLGGAPGALPVPPSPAPRRTRRPSWLDLRLVVGLVLVLGSVLLGAVVVSRAEASTAVWSLRRDLPAGSVLAEADVQAVDVRLGSSSDAYVAADRAVVGSRLAADVGAGQLLPRAALAGGGDTADLVTVSIPFATADAPSIARGDRITVWLSTPTCTSVVLLDRVGVQEVVDNGSGLTATDGLQVVVSVSPALADRVVTALSLDDVTLRAGVLSSAPTAAPTNGAELPALTGCAAADGASPTPRSS